MSQAAPALPVGHYRLKHILKSESLKVLTLPSTAVTLGVTIAAGLVVTVLVTHAAVYHAGDFGFDATQEALTGMVIAGLTGVVFGAMLITGEYASGTIRATLSATPRRAVVLVGKMVVTGAATVVFCEALSFTSFFLGEAILSARRIPGASLGSPGAFRAVFLTGLFIALLALMSFGLGLICRNTAGTISTFVGIVFVLPLVMQAISRPYTRFTPPVLLTNSIMATTPQGGPGGATPLSPGAGLLLMALYAAITLAVGAVLFLKRDA